jgi:tRNA-specific 2-thiouridylase
MPSPAPGSKVLVAMSGGVDSSVAAALLVERGYEVVGCFMRLGSPGEELEGLAPMPTEGFDASSCALPAKPDGSTPLRIGHRGCCSISDAQDARTVAARLGIPFYVCNFKKDFGRIVDYFVGEYNAGRTPNPCVRCNDWLKFGKLHEYARSIDAVAVASGHYARIVHGAQGAELHRGLDLSKDQSYVLFGARRETLHEMILPIGDLPKTEVRAMAQERGLPVFDKPDSQEICFVPDDDYAGLVARRTPAAVAPGRIVDHHGRDLGGHAGHQHFTVGQRKGLGVAAGVPLYVIGKDAASNTVTLGPRELLLAAGCTAMQSNWLIDPPTDWMPCSAKIRYNAQPVAARVRATGADTIEVRFDEPQAAVAPGQAVVCFDGSRVLGGAWIDAAVAITPP